jgi:hypothetical protein
MTQSLQNKPHSADLIQYATKSKGTAYTSSPYLFTLPPTYLFLYPDARQAQSSQFQAPTPEIIAKRTKHHLEELEVSKVS